MNTKLRILGAAAVLPLALACANAAAAQSIDYGSLESMFNEPVTTSATGSPQRSTEVPVDMTIISADDIRRSGAADLPTILGRVAGLDLMQWSAGAADIGVRGYNQAMSPRLLVLVNGRQVYLDHYGYTAWSTIPVQLDEIRQIEVVKGPNSALFGFNAVSGVVNIITYNPKFDDVSGVTLRGGQGEHGELSLVHTARIGESLSARLSGGVSRQSEWATSNGVAASALGDVAYRAGANLDVIGQISDKTELRVEGSWSGVQQSDMASNYAYSASKYITTSVKGSLASDTSLGLVQLSAYRNTMRASLVAASTPTTYHNEITVVSAQDLFKVGTRHTFRLGAEYRHNTLDAAPMGGADVSYSVLSASGMWNWAITDRFALTTALRYDKLSLKREGAFPAGLPFADNDLWDRDITEATYNLGAVWRPTDTDTLRITAAKGLQVPTLVELGAFQMVVPLPVSPWGMAVQGNPAIEPAVVTNYELSYDRALGANAKAGVRLFTQETTDIKGQPSSTQFDVLPTLTSYPSLSWVNVGDSKMSGAEVSASGKFGEGYRWSADWTWTSIEDDPTAGYNLDRRLAAFASMAPEQRGNASLGWAGRGWEVDGYVHYTGDFTSFTTAGSVSIDAYTTVAGRVARGFDNGFTVAVSGQNLLDDGQTQTSGLNAERRLFLTVSKRW